MFTYELNTWPKREIVLSPIPLESGGDIGPAFGVRDVSAGGYVFCGLEYQQGFVRKI